MLCCLPKPPLCFLALIFSHWDVRMREEREDTGLDSDLLKGVVAMRLNHPHVHMHILAVDSV